MKKMKYIFILLHHVIFIAEIVEEGRKDEESCINQIFMLLYVILKMSIEGQTEEQALTTVSWNLEHLIPYFNEILVRNLGRDGLNTLLNLIQRLIKKSNAKTCDQLLNQIYQKFLAAGEEVSRLELNDLLAKQKTRKTKLIFKLFIPNSSHRDQLETLRLQSLKLLNQGSTPQSQQLSVLLSLYHLLNIDKGLIFQEVIKYQNPSEIDSLKKIIASLKRLMGSETSMLDDEKEEKKKAYSLNLDVRDILNECLKIIQSQSAKQKLFLILNTPKNKKWLGSRLHKFLLTQGWQQEELKALVTAIKTFLEQNMAPFKGKIRNSKNTFKSMIKHIEASYKFEEQQKEIEEKMEEEEEQECMHLQKQEQIYISSFLNLHDHRKEQSIQVPTFKFDEINF